MDTSQLEMLAISDTGFIFDPRTGYSYTVNSTGLALLRSLKRGVQPSQFEDELRAAFDCPADIAMDIETFINTLLQYELTGSHSAMSHSR